ncbi:MAG: hypothetical protein FJX76_05700 [Armatimonadetes bacterium]|nr:hypothetical protein [Armatimonadota bacterium]
MVYCTLFISLLTGVYGILVAGKLSFAQAQDRGALQASVETTLGRMAAELRESTTSSLTVFPNTTAPDAPAGVIFASPRLHSNTTGGGSYDRDVTSGRPIWHKYVAWYLETSGGRSHLVRAEIPIATASTTVTACTLTTSDVHNDTTLYRRRMGEDVRSFVATIDGALIRLHYDVMRNKEAMMVNTDVRPRN